MLTFFYILMHYVLDWLVVVPVVGAVILTKKPLGDNPRGWKLIKRLAGVAVGWWAFHILFNIYADLWGNNLWFGNVASADVYWTWFAARYLPAALAFVVVFSFLWLNWRIADDSCPKIPSAVMAEKVNSYDWLSFRSKVTLWKWGFFLLFAIVGVVYAVAWSSEAERVLLFKNPGVFGISESMFRKDAGFYVYTLPFWDYVSGGLLMLTVIAPIVVMFTERHK